MKYLQIRLSKRSYQRISSLFIPPIRDIPSESVSSGYNWLIRSGFIRPSLSSGMFVLLPLAQRVYERVSSVVDHFLQGAGCTKLSLPILQSSKLWQQTGRWKSMESEMFRLQDRKHADFCLAPTHEEEITYLISNEVSSYRQLPLKLYQTGLKFRDEMRPRYGLVRGREFIMNDLYTFDETLKASKETYQMILETYDAIFKALKLPVVRAEADSGNIGGSLSHEYHMISDVGEDHIIRCRHCEYTANREKAVGQVTTPQMLDSHVNLLSLVSTGVIEGKIANSNGETFAILYASDRSLNMFALQKHLGHDVTIHDLVPKNLNQSVEILLDMSLHIDSPSVRKGQYTFTQPGDRCSNCNKPLVHEKGMELGHAFLLGDKYSKPLGATFQKEIGKEKEFVHMGCYGLGLSRMLSALAEYHQDQRGLVWPENIAPFRVCVVAKRSVSDNSDVPVHVCNVLDKVAYELRWGENTVVLDDRNKELSFSLQEAEMVGYPWLVVVGNHFSTHGKLEIRHRKTGAIYYVGIDSLLSFFKDHSKK